MNAWLRSFWLLMVLVSTLPAGAQNTVLRGRVLDAETHQPIPNAQVGVADNRIGTSTNDDGRFALNIPPAYTQERLTVALLGYKNYSRPLPPLPGPELVVELKISPAALGEVQITGSVLGIVREAVARIPRNYPVRPTQLTGFYRESDNDPAGQPRYLAEGLLLAFKEPYQRRTAEGEVQIKQSRKVDLRPDRQPIRIDWAGGPFIVHLGDFVHRRSQFINPAHFKDYDYRLAPGSTFQDRPVYVITFAPKAGNRRADFEGRMYIDQDSYAFLGAEWHYTPAGLNNSPNSADSRALRVAYQFYAGRWHLKTVWWQTKARLPIGPPLNYFGEFLTTTIDTAQTPRPGYTERAQYRDVFLHNAVAYDSAFWQGHTTLLPSTALQKSLFDQQRQQQTDSLFKPAEAGTDPQQKQLSAFDRFLKRFSYGSHVGAWPLDVPAAGLTVAYAPAGSGLQVQRTARVSAQDLTIITQFEYQYALTRELALSLATQRLYRQFKGDGWEVGLSYEHNFNSHRRPLYGRAGLGYIRQTVGLPLGTFDNPDAGLRVSGTHLGADELSARIQTVSDALRPSLGLGIELSHKFELVADASYLVPMRSKTQLQLDEESGFFLFRSSATVDLPAAAVDLRVNDQPTTRLPWQQQPWLLSIGLRYRVR
ncbi:carboxypeptidase-like regulatory domain-containing protein [Microvirga sp. STS02]|uniref:carboxypeptidase-like regulatory domain-containing protein n=1 Tax=Hymenobacter negativus TaxID=2795026 RepID=UPI0018DDDA99|nr:MULTISPECIES: carboxypeptidase-like regulatory domain-containing protein [Bacteria]MBH8570553.1 carboxypeptidase-like regulatory domain-containing protein [Hymenobacter negativus]MBR7210292.1 carboxypeptidase-like regulatory domain-containing protein [Microvirga sp. STS02]